MKKLARLFGVLFIGVLSLLMALYLAVEFLPAHDWAAQFVLVVVLLAWLGHQGMACRGWLRIKNAEDAAREAAEETVRIKTRFLAWLIAVGPQQEAQP